MHQLFEMPVPVYSVCRKLPAFGLGRVAETLEKGTQYSPQFAHLALRFQKLLAAVSGAVTGRLPIARCLQGLNPVQLIGIFVHDP